MCDPFVISRHKSEKAVTYITPQGKEARITREVYLRKDVSCHLSICPTPTCQNGYSLPTDLKHIVVVDGMYARSYWEIFESLEVRGIVVTLSTLNYAQQHAPSKAVFNRIRTCLMDPAQQCVIFDNEFHQDCFRPIRSGESNTDYTTRLNWIAAQWYKNHCCGNVDVILLTENEDVVLACAKMSPQSPADILVMGLSTYLDTYHQTLATVHQLYASLNASIKAKECLPVAGNAPVSSSIREDEAASNFPQTPAVGDVYPEHLPEAALIAGVRSRQFLRGVLRVSRFRYINEAVVVLTDASALKHQADIKNTEFASRSEIAVNGLFHRNRAVDGDVVAVKLLPRKNWTGASSDLAPSEVGVAEAIVTATCEAGADSTEETESAAQSIATSNTTSTTTTNLPCGFVVGVITRNWRDYVCTLVPPPGGGTREATTTHSSSPGWILATPWDRRIPRVRLYTSDPSQLAKDRFVVRLDRWEASSNYPSAHFIQSLGPIGDLETETQTILVEHGLAHRPFTTVQLDELAHLSGSGGASRGNWCVDPSEVARRRDIRAEGALVFSIDPPGCQDVDDALSVRWMKGGSGGRVLQLGVHIADVTHFVRVGGNLDAEARRRSTSVYLADRKYDMLPGILSGDVCSLLSGVDRYAVSVIWELEPETLEVLGVWYGRTVIRSAYKMTYKAAQTIHDLKGLATDGGGSGFSGPRILKALGGEKVVCELIPELAGIPEGEKASRLTELHAAIGLLVRVASDIRHLRVARGGLELESAEVSMLFENPEERTGALKDIVPKEPLEMHSTVAELMIFANHWVAKACLEAFPERSCLRRHPAPRTEYFEELKKCAASRGFRLEVDSNRALAASLTKAVDAGDPEVNNQLRQLATRAMTNALYFSTGSEELTRDLFGHYGLALNLYTHFTSPIRRYADMVVHRVLMKATLKTTTSNGGTTYKDDLYEHDELTDICRHMNERHWAAQRAQRSSIELFQALFFRDRPADDPCRYADGVICQLRGNNGFVVNVPRYGVRGNVCLRHADGRTAWIPKEDKRGIVFWLSADTPCEVVRSSMPTAGGEAATVTCDQLAIIRDGKSQFYRIFDHVTVYIQVAESMAHGVGLRLELFAKPRFAPIGVATSMKQNESRADEEMIDKVRVMDEERKKKRGQTVEEDMEIGSKIQRISSGEEDMTTIEEAQNSIIANLHTPSSFYHQFKRVYQKSRSDMDAS